ncbi:MAG: pseudouridine synthase [Panacibacter sp.]
MIDGINRYFIINKPTDMLSQFVSSNEARLLGNLDFNFPEGIHAIGRLDSNSEGLLILTTNKKVTKLLFQGTKPHTRVYLIMVKNKVSEESLQQLRAGVEIRVTGGGYYTTPACDVTIETKPEYYVNWGYQLPAHIPHTWLHIPLTEGKFRQVRKMASAINHRCIRLIRVAIEDITLGDLLPGAVREMDEQTFFKLLKIDHPANSNLKTVSK